ncbi:cellulase family glycosylhydrolase [Mycolicibacterium holsaticum]|uniref:cellulase family glycosylhydrolase n=1 Tax=Mycolicibacterium holsaticum TaxID=152142 RepID=UPI000ABD0F38|nr:cellulase family glycosylhydrolase [Mycolicibacterium holsaticum]
MRKLLQAVVALAAVVLVSAGLTQMLAPDSDNTRSVPVTETAAVSSLGFADSWLWFLSPDDVNRQLDLMVNTGVRSARIMMPWAGIQPAPQEWNWGQADLIVNAANARGIAVVALLNSTPGWATGGGPAVAAPPASAEAFGTFAGTMASHFAGRVAAYELWNEQNAVQFWAGPAGPQPDRFAGLLKAAYPAIKAADPNATVVAGGLSPTINFFSVTMNPVTYVERMYAAGAKGFFDALAFHPYLFTNNVESRFSTGAANSPRGLYNALRQQMAANGDGGKQIWATEFGEATSKVSEATQADRIRDFIVSWRTLDGAGPAFIYTTRDRSTGSANPQDNYGVYRTDWTPKPAADVMRSLA